MSSQILTICISTYNAAHLLRVTLGALLPQVASLGDLVEVLVVDDVSTDDTQGVVETAKALGPVRHVRNEKNLGSSPNLVNGPVNHARGEFVWCWNQHCLLYPGALARVVEALQKQSHLDVFYANFRCADYPSDWPQQAVGGYDGPFRYLGHQNLEDRAVDCWHELLEPLAGMGTQSYAHIVKRHIWTTFWAHRILGFSYQDAISTYPHTYMLAHTVLHQPSCFIGQPVITIYNGAQSWGDLASRSRVWMWGWADLINHYRKLGLPKRKIVESERWGSLQVVTLVSAALKQKNPVVLQMVPRFLWKHGKQSGVVSSTWQAFLVSRCCRLARGIVGFQLWWKRTTQYLFYQCRPARWIRAHSCSGGTERA